MTDPTDQWSQIANLTPRLRETVRIHRHRYRGQRWYILRDGVTGTWQRVNRSAYRFIRLLDGSNNLTTARANATDGDNEFSEHDGIAVLDALNRAELLDWGVPQDTPTMHDRASQARRRKRLAQLMSPFSIRVPLFDPDRFLEQRLPLSRTLFSSTSFCVALLIMTIGILFATAGWPAITGYWSTRGFTTHNFVLIPIVYILIKTVHELAHGLAAKRWGGEVHEMGIVLLLLIPIPYVDASSAWAFPEKHRRMIVGAAGIIAELVMAALATIVFVTVEPGVVKDFAYTTMLLGSVSTLLFNGNPLLRFDGYYVLADAIEIPNLAPRATRYWAYLAQRYLLGISEARSPISAHGERRWLLGYGAAASLYRLMITLAIALFVATELPVLGIALAVWALVAQIGVPWVRHAHFVLTTPALTGRRRRAVGVSAAILAGGLVVLLAIPIPLSTHAQGVVWLPEHAHVRAGTDGSIVETFTFTDQAVEAGAPLLRIDNPLLDARIAGLRWELEELTMRHNAARVGDRIQTQVLADSISTLREDLASLEVEAASLFVTSPVTGTLVIPKSTHLKGRFLHKGDLIGYVLENTTSTVRTVVPQTAIGELRGGVQTTEVRLAEAPGTTLSATISREIPSATQRLPSAALGTLGGGPVAVNPADPSGLTAVDGIYLVDVSLDQHALSARAGGRVHVRFEHSAEPVGFRIYRALRRLLLSRLAV